MSSNDEVSYYVMFLMSESGSPILTKSVHKLQGHLMLNNSVTEAGYCRMSQITSDPFVRCNSYTCKDTNKPLFLFFFFLALQPGRWPLRNHRGLPNLNRYHTVGTQTCSEGPVRRKTVPTQDHITPYQLLTVIRVT
jgi:hypothetical protein